MVRRTIKGGIPCVGWGCFRVFHETVGLEPHNTPQKRAGKIEGEPFPSHFMGGVQVALL